MSYLLNRRLAAAFVLSIGCWVGNASAAPRASLVGHDAPSLIAPTMSGDSVDLSALRGHIVVLNVWASWCPPCRAELPMLAHVQERHRADGVVLIALSADRHRDRDDARLALKGLPITGAFMDGATRNGYANPDVLPITYLIDAEGVVRGEFLPGQGPLQETELEAKLAALLPAT